MVKIKKSHIISFLLLITIPLILSSCAKPQCKTTAECAPKVCALAKCLNQKCVYTEQSNCCGNEIKESVENGKQGNKCTCPQDFGRCEGIGKVKIGAKLEDAKYAHYYCSSADECIMGVEEKDVAPQNFLDTISAGMFKATSVMSYNKPFDIGSDSFKFDITLDDFDENLIFPVQLTRIKILYNSKSLKVEQLIADLGMNDELNDIGDKITITTKLNLNYKPQEIEEEGLVRYAVDYSYVKSILTGAPVGGSEETVRATFTSPTKPVIFVKSELR